MTQPLLRPQKLAGNPQSKPQFSVSVKFKGSAADFSDPKAQRALISLMDMQAVMGGAASHFGGPAAFAEIVSAVHGIMFLEAAAQKKPWFELFNFVNDAGHCENGIYAIKANYLQAGLNFKSLEGFRSLESVLTGHGESHLFPEGVYLSNGPLGSALPQSQGLAMADRHAGRDRVTLTLISDGACMEGEAREALAAIPGLASRDKLSAFVMVISDNNTKLSGRIDQDCFPMSPSFDAMKVMGWKVIEVKNGNDLQSMVDAIEAAISTARANPSVPVAVHAKTLKGFGNKKLVDSASGGHGFPLKSPKELAAFVSEIYGDEKFPNEFQNWIAKLIEIEAKTNSSSIPVPNDKIQVGVAKALIASKKAGWPVISITSDLPGSTGVAAFRKEFPSESFDVGVAESNMVSVAAGFSKSGFIPVVDTFAQFGTTKGALPLIMASLSEAPIIGIYSHTGFQDAADGASHQSLNYLALTMGIPHCRIVALGCMAEAEALVGQCIEEFGQEMKAGRTPMSTLFFLGRENFPLRFGDQTPLLGKPQIYRENFVKDRSVMLMGVGSMLNEAMSAAYKLKDKNIGSLVVQPSTLVPFDFLAFKSAAEECGRRVVVIEDHQAIGGFTEHLSRLCLEHNFPIQLKLLAVKGEFGRSAYSSNDLYKLHGLNSDHVVKAAGYFFASKI